MAELGPTVATAIQHGLVVPLTRLETGLQNLRQYKDIIDSVPKGDIPVGFIYAKAAWESNGVPTTMSATQRDVGLYQFQVPCSACDKRIGDETYKFEDLKNPLIATEAFVKLVNGWVLSLLHTHGQWFPEGRAWPLWKTLFLFGGIGPGATRHMLNAIVPGGNSFERVVAFTLEQADTGWFDKLNNEAFWGKQTGQLVAFRIVLAQRLMARAEELTPSVV